MKKSYIVILALLLSSCSNGDDNSQEGTETGTVTELVGEWTWVQSTGSIAGITVTPESSGKTMRIEFTEENVFNKFVDGVEVYTSPFVIDEDNIQYTTLALFESVGLGFDHQVEQQFQFREGNTLVLTDPCCDNFTFQFVKAQ
ncbi:hypothetical protein [Spongiimicrobium sp. 2-473A-2-J]|uniref:hypothetical protein n=1 Tax=Eudoraea algarum TaxID=3417568 RepID=UPI003D35C739